MARDDIAIAHDCSTCPGCLHDGAQCCGCYDGACCQPHDAVRDTLIDCMTSEGIHGDRAAAAADLILSDESGLTARPRRDWQDHLITQDALDECDRLRAKIASVEALVAECDPGDTWVSLDSLRAALGPVVIRRDDIATEDFARLKDAVREELQPLLDEVARLRARVDGLERRLADVMEHNRLGDGS